MKKLKILFYSYINSYSAMYLTAFFACAITIIYVIAKNVNFITGIFLAIAILTFAQGVVKSK